MRCISLLLMCSLAVLAGQSAMAGPGRGAVCEFPDLGGITAVPVESGASEAAGIGGDIPAVAGN